VEIAAASRREAHQAFEDLCDLRSRQTEISMPPLLFQGQDFRLVKLPKMTAGRGRRDASLECELRRGEGTAVHQSRQHACAGRVAQERTDARDVGNALHASMIDEA
jgi:hypothetical protein